MRWHFIKKKIKKRDKLVQDQFLQPVKDHPCFKEKNMSFTFSRFLMDTKLFRKCLVSPWNGWFANFRPDIAVCIINVMICIKKNCQNSFGQFFLNCWRSPLCWSLIFFKTYKFLWNMWCVMCEVWCMMFQTWFFVRSGLYESRGDQKHPILGNSDLFNVIPKLILGGSRMYTISCKGRDCHQRRYPV